MAQLPGVGQRRLTRDMFCLPDSAAVMDPTLQSLGPSQGAWHTCSPEGGWEAPGTPGRRSLGRIQTEWMRKAEEGCDWGSPAVGRLGHAGKAGSQPGCRGIYWGGSIEDLVCP